MTESRISSALRGSLQQLQNATVGRLGRSGRKATSSGNAVQPFPVPFSGWPDDVMLEILPHAVERHSGFALAGQRARGLHLENAIGVVRAAVQSGGCSGADVVKARDAYRFLQKVVFAAAPTAIPALRATVHAGCESARLSSAVGLMAASARDALNEGVVPAQDAPAARAADRAIETFLSYVRIEAGTFLMGSPDTERGRRGDEVLHHVKLIGDFMLKATAVTQEEWFEVMGNNPSHFKSDGPNGERAAKRPVEMVSWLDGAAYMNALSLRDGYTPCYDLSACRGTPGVIPFTAIPFNENADGYRYPTEAEQEYSIRAGTKGLTYAAALGKILDDIAWTYGNSGHGPHPVAQKLPNAFGLYDTLGNVWEWGGDFYGPLAPAGHDNPAVDPRGADASAGVFRVYRGVGWRSGRCNAEHYARAANRGHTHSAARYDDLGLRPARSLFT